MSAPRAGLTRVFSHQIQLVGRTHAVTPPWIPAPHRGAGRRSFANQPRIVLPHTSSYRGNPVPTVRLRGWAHTASTTPNRQATFSYLGAPVATGMENSSENSPSRPASSCHKPRRTGETRYPRWGYGGGHTHAGNRFVVRSRRAHPAPHRGYRIESGKSKNECAPLSSPRAALTRT